MTEERDTDAVRLLIDSLPQLAAAGVRVFEVGHGPTRVRVELEPASAPTLIRRTVRDMLRESAPDHPALQASPEQADDSDDQQDATPEQGAADKPAGDDLDLAHLT